ncbi:uncharacterized protein LOC128732767 [Sabethes cyaneus]|uniref:uncharacterized protein LOC128732767 n=1 Tax=Sabethes cyaneus TaxID=53552 RepID=UPI00237D986F|nr:uncharacterized protein LOC128732767 [Sabethes cyaneus]
MSKTTLASYSNCMQVICAENVICTRVAEQLRQRAENVMARREAVALRIHEKHLEARRLDEEILKLMKESKPVQECVAVAEARAAEQLQQQSGTETKQQQSAGQEELTGQASLNQLPYLLERRRFLEQERPKLLALKRTLAESLDRNNIWDILPNLMEENKMIDDPLESAEIVD